MVNNQEFIYFMTEYLKHNPNDYNVVNNILAVFAETTKLPAEAEFTVFLMYSQGTDTAGIAAAVSQKYNTAVTESDISKIIDTSNSKALQWQQRPLSSVYAAVYLETLPYHIKAEGKITSIDIHFLLGTDTDGRRDILGIYPNTDILPDITSRCVTDIFAAYSDLPLTLFENTDTQISVVHQIQRSLKGVKYTNLRKVSTDLKAIYAAKTEQLARMELDLFEEAHANDYPEIAADWQKNWTPLSQYFNYPEQIRKLAYTTNTSDVFRRKISQAVPNKAAYISKKALINTLSLAAAEITKTWTGKRQDWSSIHKELVQYYGKRM